VSRPRRRLGLFGGSFDPIHTGHLHAARAARDSHALDRVVFVPAARPPHKSRRELESGVHRTEMIRRAIAGEPRFELSTLELERAGPSYTIDTVRALRRALGEPDDAEIYLVLGSDNLAGLASWRSVRDIVAETQPIVVLREGGPSVDWTELERVLGPELAARLRSGVLPTPPAPGCSTDLRASLSRGELESAEIPAPVREYVRAHGLYRSHS
jgi:nicotinate-nucleotide adenylyltransferase